MSNNPFDEMRRATQAAELQLIAADNTADDMVRILKGRLRKVRPWQLKELKAELKEFNSTTGKWKS